MPAYSKNSLRVIVALGVFIALAVSNAAQTPTTPSPANKMASNKPLGSLIQVMRGVLFNNANLIFDVQQVDPGAPVKPHATEFGATQTANFSNVYSGWQVIENAAVALDESVDTILRPGRTCDNGTPVPVERA